MKIRIIAAVGKNRELGNKGGLPLWSLSTDMARFKKLTEGGVVVMGRKTFESFPDKYRPLPNRKNIVLTRDKNWKQENVESYENLNQASVTDSIWIIGGGEIYKQYIDEADELHITHVDGEFDADTFFPSIDENVWKIISEEKVEADEKNSHNSTYTIYTKK
jgi:dihydrofolate reductase